MSRPEEASPMSRPEEASAMQPIVANSVLPAIREPLHLHTADGLSLVGELARPQHADPIATVVTVHPLPTHGGMMDSHVYRKMAWRLPALADIAVLRFNTRGTTSAAGTSEGAFDEARGEGLDLQAAVAEVVRRGLPDPWVIGWSFGTDVILKNGDVDPIVGAILLSPPLRFTTEDELRAWSGSPRRLVCLVPEFDDYLVPEAAAERFAAVPHAEVRGVSGAKHLWVGEKYVKTVLDEVVGVVAPERAPLPTEWAGPMERWSDL